MTKQWYHKLGFSSNPFSIKPAAFHNEIIGYNLDDIFNRIETGDMMFIEGTYGSGKTTILKHIIARFGGKKKVIYYNCSISEGLDTQKLLLGRSSFSKFFKVLPSDMILLIDEAQGFGMNDSKDLLPFFANNVKSVVFLGAQYKPNAFPKDMRKFLDGNVTVLNKLTPEQAIELVRRRIGNIGILSDEIIKKVYSYPNLNPRTLLENCEDLCRYAVESGGNTVNTDHIKAVLKKDVPQKIKVQKALKKPKVLKKPAKKVSELQKKVAPKKKKAAPKKPRKKKQKIEIEEVSADTSQKVGFEYNIDNIRTYEEEMSTIKKDESP